MKQLLKSTALKFFELKEITSIGISEKEIIGVGDIKELKCYIIFFEGFEGFGCCQFQR